MQNMFCGWYRIWKKNKLKDNIKCLEDLSFNLDKKINELKTLYETIDKNKQTLKCAIQNIFTKIRNALNEREDQLLFEVDNRYNEFYYFNEDIMQNCENLLNKIKSLLKKGKDTENNWNKDKAISLINNCLNIENYIKEIKLIYKNLDKIHSLNVNVEFYFNEEDRFIQIIWKNKNTKRYI